MTISPIFFWMVGEAEADRYFSNSHVSCNPISLLLLFLYHQNFHPDYVIVKESLKLIIFNELLFLKARGPSLSTSFEFYMAANIVNVLLSFTDAKGNKEKKKKISKYITNS